MKPVWSKLLHAAVLPVVVGLSIWLVEGTFSMDRFAETWPVTVLLVLAYLGAWALNVALERYPFFGQFEAALLSAACAFVPVGFVLYPLLVPPLQMIAIVATVRSVAVYLVDQFFHQFRYSRLVVIPGGVSFRLLAAPGVTPMKEVRLDSVEVDAIVADLHNSAGLVPAGHGPARADGGPDPPRRVPIRIAHGPSPSRGGLPYRADCG